MDSRVYHKFKATIISTKFLRKLYFWKYWHSFPRAGVWKLVQEKNRIAVDFFSRLYLHFSVSVVWINSQPKVSRSGKSPKSHDSPVFKCWCWCCWLCARSWAGAWHSSTNNTWTHTKPKTRSCAFFLNSSAKHFLFPFICSPHAEASSVQLWTATSSLKGQTSSVGESY